VTPERQVFPVGSQVATLASLKVPEISEVGQALQLTPSSLGKNPAQQVKPSLSQYTALEEGQVMQAPPALKYPALQ